MMSRPTILGVPVDAINMAKAVETITAWIESRDSQYVCVTPAHSIMDCRDDPELLAIFQRSGLSTPDGMAVVWLLKWLGYERVSRVYGPNLLLALLERGLSKAWSHYFYGGRPEVLERFVGAMQMRFPSLNIAGYYAPPFRPLTLEEDDQIIRAINDAHPDIIWIGLGAPKQERWMDSHRPQLLAPVMVGVGAAFDFLSGEKSQAPTWIQNLGVEWLFRLISEPARLWPRYRRYPHFAWLALGQLMGFSANVPDRDSEV